MTVTLLEFGSLSRHTHAALFQALDEKRLQWRGMSLARLGRLATDFQVECQPFLRSWEEKDAAEGWQASRWVGRFPCDGETYCIKPRIGWPRFEVMLETVLSVGRQEGGAFRRSMSDEVDLARLVWVLAHEIAWRRHRGAAKAFVRREERDAPALRGELNLAAQLVKFTDRHTLACRYDDLTYDHPVNRGSLLAIKKLQQHGDFPFNGTSTYDRIVREWREALTSNGVETPAHFPAGFMRWSRANDGFRAAHALAEIVVGERQATATSGGGAAAFLFDSAEVWELYLCKQLSAVVGELTDKLPGYTVEWPRERPGPLDALLVWESTRVAAQIPDIRIRKPDRSVALVIDAKYRRFKPPTEDVEIAIQMFHYAATAKGPKEEHWPPAVLIYPSCTSPDLNPRPGESGPFPSGRGLFGVGDKSSLSAWWVALPQIGDEQISLTAFQNDVRRQLKKIIEKELGLPLKSDAA
jgi:McrBC 5-methylcytosine restriction system component